MVRRRRSSEGEEGPERSWEEWLEEKKLWEDNLEEETRKTRLDSLMFFRIDGGAVLEVVRYECERISWLT